MSFRQIGWFIGIAGLALAIPVRAQQAGEAFQTITLHAGASFNVNRRTLHPYWQPGAGAVLALQTPFYAGVVELESGFHHYAAARDDLDAFSAVPLTLGWGPRLQLVPRLHVTLSVRVGNYLMFVGNLPSWQSSESELMLGVEGRLSWRVLDPWALTLTGSYHRVFTHVRIDLWYVSLGVSRRLRMPGWLKDFLR